MAVGRRSVQRDVVRDGCEAVTATATAREERAPARAGADFFATSAEAERVTAGFFAAVTPCAAQALAGHDFVSQTAEAVADFARSHA